MFSVFNRLLKHSNIVMTNTMSGKALYLVIFGSAFYFTYKFLTGNRTTVLIDDSTPETRSDTKKTISKVDPIVEICLSDIVSVHNALIGQANSVELCVNRAEGGVTPSVGMIEEAVRILRATPIAVNVLIRPRPGNFVYSPAECDVIQRDILLAKLSGADGDFYQFFRLIVYSC